MNRAEFLKMMVAGQALTPGSDATEFMQARAVQTRLLCHQLNSGVHSAEHPEQRSTLHPRPIHVENDVWIGSNAVILQGVTIGEGSIVAAGAVVTKDVPARHIVAGNPARVIRPIRS